MRIKGKDSFNLGLAYAIHRLKNRLQVLELVDSTLRSIAKELPEAIYMLEDAVTNSENTWYGKPIIFDSVEASILQEFEAQRDQPVEDTL